MNAPIAPNPNDIVELYGVKDGIETRLGTVTMPPAMKARAIVTEMMGTIDEEIGNDAAIALWCCQQLIEWMVQTPTVVTVETTETPDQRVRPQDLPVTVPTVFVATPQPVQPLQVPECILGEHGITCVTKHCNRTIEGCFRYGACGNDTVTPAGSRRINERRDALRAEQDAAAAPTDAKSDLAPTQEAANRFTVHNGGKHIFDNSDKDGDDPKLTIDANWESPSQRQTYADMIAARLNARAHKTEAENPFQVRSTS